MLTIDLDCWSAAQPARAGPLQILILRIAAQMRLIRLRHLIAASLKQGRMIDFGTSNKFLSVGAAVEKPFALIEAQKMLLDQFGQSAFFETRFDLEFVRQIALATQIKQH